MRESLLRSTSLSLFERILNHLCSSLFILDHLSWHLSLTWGYLKCIFLADFKTKHSLGTSPSPEEISNVRKWQCKNGKCENPSRHLSLSWSYLKCKKSWQIKNFFTSSSSTSIFLFLVSLMHSFTKQFSGLISSIWNWKLGILDRSFFVFAFLTSYYSRCGGFEWPVLSSYYSWRLTPFFVPTQRNH